MTFRLVLPLSPILHIILPLCLLEPFPDESCQPHPHPQAQETSNTVPGMTLLKPLKSVAATTDCQLLTQPNYKLLGEK